MTIGFAAITLGAIWLYTAFTNNSVSDLIRGTPSPGQPADRFAAIGVTDAGTSGTADTSSGGTSKVSPGHYRSGSSVYKGIEICNWIIDIIKAAEADVGPLQPTSGVRRGYDPHTATGATCHSGCAQGSGAGTGAVDFGGYEGSPDAEKFRGWLSKNGWPMLDAAHAGYHDLGHFSRNGH